MPALPTGNITFVFTDIEGSTRLWERHPDLMRQSLARHDELLHSTIASHGGYIFKTVGDAFCAAFSDAQAALNAALDIHRALLHESWPDEIGTLKVRIGLHTGTAEERDGDYFGPTLNRVARLQAAGYGGQTLISQVTTDLIRDTLPEAVTLRDLGARRLKDLIQPEHIFQVNVPDLPGEFPALKTLDARPTNLPAQPNAFMGRERELGEVKRLLSERRLLTLTGPGGIGKTRLALQTAADLVDDFEHGVYFVELAPISDPALVASTIAQVLEVEEVAGKSTTQSLKSHLRERQMLLVLDNFEQILDAAPLVSELLTASPHLKVLATSREELNLYSESEYPVPPLALPDLNQRPLLPTLMRYASVKLFVERVQAIKLDFRLDEDNAQAVAEICVRLEGLPLAIELAAGRGRRLTPHEILTQLSHRLDTLSSSFRDLPARQRTLRGAIDWSYDLLKEDDKALFTGLSVFNSGWTVQAAQTVCAGRSQEVVTRLESLVDKNLVRREIGQEPRYFMLETIREYAQERLQTDDDAHALYQRHADYYVELSQEAERGLLGQQQAMWLDRLETEHNNLRAALTYLLRQGTADPALQLASAVYRFWNWRGHIAEGRSWFEQALALSEPTPQVRTKALYSAAMMAWSQQDMPTAKMLLMESRDTSHTVDDQLGMARALLGLGIISVEQSEYSQATSYYEQSLTLFRELNDERGIQICLNNLGVQATYLKQHARAKELYQESLDHSRSQGDLQSIAKTLANLAEVAGNMGDMDSLRRYAEEALELYRGLKSIEGITVCCLHMANYWIYEGDARQAQSAIDEGLPLAVELGNKAIEAQGLMRLADIAVLENRFTDALTQAHRAIRLSELTGNKQLTLDLILNMTAVLNNLGDFERTTLLLAGLHRHTAEIGGLDGLNEDKRYQKAVAALQENLGEQFASLWEIGAAYTFSQLVEAALEAGP
jgi:predicted ATPase/class 3 adenylate cyclase